MTNETKPTSAPESPLQSLLAHGPPGPVDVLERFLVTPELDTLLARVERQSGHYDFDPWGFSLERAKLLVGLIKRLYDSYFRVTAHGLEHVPARGRALVIANHSGQLPIDATLIAIAMLTNPHGPRAPRAMIERFFPKVPFIGNLLNRAGAVIGDPLNCARMLENEEAIIVFPEGVRGSGKLYKHRYQLQRFGNGFMHLAMEHHTPIVPVGVVGCEETMPSLANIKPVAQALGLPYFPLTSYVPLPARVSLYFGEPMEFTGEVTSEADIVARVEQVKGAIKALIDRGLGERESIF
jgi:1-acyl-sn-glycerol-3-phosphate acyltransferase